MSNPKQSNVSLVRGLTLIAATSIVIGNVIGTGVFLKARVMTCNVGSPGKVVLVWIAAGLLSLAGALTYAELAAMMPRAGAEYIFIRDAYGRPPAFLYGWMQIFIAKTGSQAALAVAFALFLNDLLGGTLSGKFFAFSIAGYEIPFGKLQVVALATIAIVTLINCAKVVVSGVIATVLTGVKISLILGIGFGALLFASNGDWSHFSLLNVGGTCDGVSDAARFGLAGFGAAMLGALWGYDGWNNITLVAGEVKDPQRNIPLALIIGMFTIITLYVFANVMYFYALAPTAVASVPKSSSVAIAVATTFHIGGKAVGPVILTLITAALMASSLGSLHTSILTGARVPYAMALDGMFFKRLSKLSQSTHVPIRALVLQGVWASVLAISGSFDTITDYVIFGSWIFYGLATASVFVFRKKMPDAERPYRAWGYPVVPILFLFVTGWLLINTLMTTFVQAMIGIVLILIGLPFYFAIAPRREINSNGSD